MVKLDIMSPPGSLTTQTSGAASPNPMRPHRTRKTSLMIQAVENQKDRAKVTTLERRVLQQEGLDDAKRRASIDASERRASMAAEKSQKEVMAAAIAAHEAKQAAAGAAAAAAAEAGGETAEDGGDNSLDAILDADDGNASAPAASPEPEDEKDDDIEVPEMPPEDPLDDVYLDLLCMRPDDRETQHVDKIGEVMSKLAPSFTSSLSDDQLQNVARGCLYHYFTPGSILCDPDEEVGYYFIVLAGEVDLKEVAVSHLEGMSGNVRESLRQSVVKGGGTFHHFPLVMQYRFYGYTAEVCSRQGASVLLIPKADYVMAMRRAVEKDMLDTVNLLRGTPFFSSWSETSMNRLFFWFTKKRLRPEEDVVRMGDDADFCFIIRSGRCDVLVPIQPDEEDAASCSGKGFDSASTAGGASPAPPNRDAAGAPAAEGATPSSLARKSLVQSMSEKRKSNLKMAAASRFKSAAGQDGPDSTPLRANFRHIVTLRPGAIVGEIALFKEGAKRMATVRSTDHVELLILDKKSFFDLDRQTLTIISENARYNAACTKEPSQRTRDDLMVLQARTSHLSRLTSLSSDVHLEICRVMKYRKLHEGAVLVRKGMPATCLYIIISGSANLYTTDPGEKRGYQRRGSWQAALSGAGSPFQSTGAAGVAAKFMRAAQGASAKGASAFATLKPNEVVRAGQTIGEDELLQTDPVHQFSAVTAEPVELMEIARRDFDRVLKADRTSEKGMLMEFLSSLDFLEGSGVFATQSLANLVTRKSFMRNQLCFAHPPEPSLGSASYNSDYIYVLFSGEARLVAAPSPDVTYVSDTKDSALSYGPMADTPPPLNAKVQAHVSAHGPPATVATLGPGECIYANMMPHLGSRWCLKPTSHLEVLVLPRKEFGETLRSSALAALQSQAKMKATFFQEQLDANPYHLNMPLSARAAKQASPARASPQRSARQATRSPPQRHRVTSPVELVSEAEPMYETAASYAASPVSSYAPELPKRGKSPHSLGSSTHIMSGAQVRGHDSPRMGPPIRGRGHRSPPRWAAQVALGAGGEGLGSDAADDDTDATAGGPAAVTTTLKGPGSNAYEAIPPATKPRAHPQDATRVAHALGSSAVSFSKDSPLRSREYAPISSLPPISPGKAHSPEKDGAGSPRKQPATWGNSSSSLPAIDPAARGVSARGIANYPDYSPVIYLDQKSDMGSRPLINVG